MHFTPASRRLRRLVSAVLGVAALRPLVALASPSDAATQPARDHAAASDVIHGVPVQDPERWLEDASSSEVQAWMADEDAAARRTLASVPEREAIAARLRQLMYVDSTLAPVQRGTRTFTARRLANQEKRVVYWREGRRGRERVLLDPNTWSTDGSVSLGNWRVSWDGRTVAYTVHQNNSDEAVLHVMDVGSGKVSDVDTIEGARYAEASWTPDGRGFYYTGLPTDPAIPAAELPGHAEVRFHRLGEDPRRDTVVHEKTGDPSTFIGAGITRDGHWLVLGIYHGWTANDVYVRDMRDDGTGAPVTWTPIAAGKRAHYAAEEHADRLYVKTDEDAPNGKVMSADPARPSQPWTTVVAERADATLEGMSVLGGRLALHYLKDAASVLEVRELDGTLVRGVALPGVGSVGGPYGRDDDDVAYFDFESFTVPREVHGMSMRNGRTWVQSRTNVPVEPSKYVVEQTSCKSKDGTRVSMFVVHGKDQKPDGTAPAILSGYGGFRISNTPEFTSWIYPWLERGGVYVVANLRGGGEYGEQWHREGMLLKKQNVFDDFIAAADHLVQSGWTRPDRLVIEGGSNGGLLVGAALTQRPNLCAAALCGVPLLDMVRYHLFGAGKTWMSEYGSADDPEQFKALYAYSPYHHVVAGTKYPAVLLLSADSDDRVDPMHARKFTAALQSATTGGPVLLRIERHAGHGGADLVKARVERDADRLAFALAQTRSE